MSSKSILLRRLNDLELRKLRGMTQAEYTRQRSIIQKQMDESTTKVDKDDGGISVPQNIADKIYERSVLAIGNAPLSVSEFYKGDGGFDYRGEWKKAIMRYYPSIYSGVDAGEPATKFSDPFSAAEKVWSDHGGVILCECDFDDCERIIPIDHDHYIQACGQGGYYRVTAQDCPYGCLGYWLSENDKHWRVWAK